MDLRVIVSMGLPKEAHKSIKSSKYKITDKNPSIKDLNILVPTKNTIHMNNAFIMYSPSMTTKAKKCKQVYVYAKNLNLYVRCKYLGPHEDNLSKWLPLPQHFTPKEFKKHLEEIVDTQDDYYSMKMCITKQDRMQSLYTLKNILNL